MHILQEIDTGLQDWKLLNYMVRPKSIFFHISVQSAQLHETALGSEEVLQTGLKIHSTKSNSWPCLQFEVPQFYSCHFFLNCDTIVGQWQSCSKNTSTASLASAFNTSVFQVHHLPWCKIFHFVTNTMINAAIGTSKIHCSKASQYCFVWFLYNFHSVATLLCSPLQLLTSIEWDKMIDPLVYLSSDMAQ